MTNFTYCGNSYDLSSSIAQASNLKMRAIYRGISYEVASPTVCSTKAKAQAKYRGVTYQTPGEVAMTPSSLRHQLIYRGAHYSIVG